MTKNPLLPQGVEAEKPKNSISTPTAPAWFAELPRLAHLEQDLALLPVGWGAERKGPMLDGWQHHPGFTVAQLLSRYGIRSVGARTGMHTGPLLCFDIDGATALELACSLGMEPSAVTTWQVHRTTDANRLKVLFRPTLEQLQQLPGGAEFQGKTITAPKTESTKGEALEVFFDGGRQVIVLGEHPSSGGHYYWPNEMGPGALTAPPEQWWQHALESAVKAQQPTSSGSKPSSTRNGTRLLNPCPVCGRHSGGESGLWCAETSTGLVLCMPGSTYNVDPSGTMPIGTVVNGYALVKRTCKAGADYLTFAPYRSRKRHFTRHPEYLKAERRRAARG